jgi:hypothetical protein
MGEDNMPTKNHEVEAKRRVSDRDKAVARAREIIIIALAFFSISIFTDHAIAAKGKICIIAGRPFCVLDCPGCTGASCKDACTFQKKQPAKAS